jgi:hypothetical protein
MTEIGTQAILPHEPIRSIPWFIYTIGFLVPSMKNFDAVELCSIQCCKDRQYNKILMMLHDIMVTQCADRGIYALAAGSTNFAGRWIYQQ